MNDGASLTCHLLSKSSNSDGLSEADAVTAPTGGPPSSQRKLAAEDERGPSPPSAFKSEVYLTSLSKELPGARVSLRDLRAERGSGGVPKRRRRVQTREIGSIGGFSQSHSSADDSENLLRKRRARSRNHLVVLASKKSDRSGHSNQEDSSYASSSDSQQKPSGPKVQAHRVPVLAASDGASPQHQSTSSRQIQRPPVDTLNHGFSRGLSYAAFDRGGLPFTRGHAFSIRHKWLLVSHQFDFWFRDRFHMLLSLSFKSLVIFLVFAEAMWAATLAIFLAIVTQGDVEHCLGGFVTHWINYYYFTVETMFTIGFGEPRYPSCLAANIFVSFAVMLTNVLHGVLIGLVFSKFSSGTTRRWAMAFSPEICGAISGDLFPIEEEFNSPRNTSPAIINSETNKLFLYPPAAKVLNTQEPYVQEDNADQRSIQTLSEHICDEKLSDVSRSVARSLQSPRGSVSNTRTFGRRKSSVLVSAGQPRELIKYYQHTYDSTGITRSTFPSRVTDSVSAYYGDSGATHEHVLSSMPGSGKYKSPTFPPARSSVRKGFQPRRNFIGVPEEQSPLCPRDSEIYCDRSILTVPFLPSKPSPDLQPESGHLQDTEDGSILNLYDNVSIGYSLSFRLMNLTDSSFFDPKLSIFLLCHDLHDLTITQVLRYHTDIPLEFLEMPITVTIDSRDTESPLNSISLPELVRSGGQYELVVLLTFVDNQSSRTIELRKSWRLDCIMWGHGFKNIVRRDEKGRPGAYDVDIEALDEKYPLDDDLNAKFCRVVDRERQVAPRPSRPSEERVDVVIPVQRSRFS